MGLFRRRRPARQRYGYRIVNPNEVGLVKNPVRAELARIAGDIPEAQQQALTAAGEKVTSSQATYLRRLILPWQIRTFGYYDLVGEFKFAAEYYARSISQLRLFAAELNDEGEPIPTDKQEAKDALARIRDPGGSGRQHLQAAYGRLMFLTGEALLFVWNNPATGLEQWEMLSTDELRLLDGNYTRFLAPTLPAMAFRPAPNDAFVPVENDDGVNQGPGNEFDGYGTGEAVAYRLHKPHPRFSSLADSTSEGVLDILEELVLLTQVVRARVRSRLAGAGVLFIDDRIGTKPQEAAPDEDPYEDPFIEDFTEAVMSPIVDEGTASAVVPLIVRVAVPDGMKLSDLVYHLQIVDPLQIYPETGLRTECIRRLAMALDMPAEALLGYSDTNHWNAWIIDETAWKAHIQPVANGLVNDLTAAYFLPYLRDVVGLPDWDKYLIAYDAASVINHPNQSKDAITLHDKGIIGDEAVRTVTGFTEDDAPTKEELARAVGIATRDSSLAWDGVPRVTGGALEPEAGVVVQAGQTTGTPIAPTGAETQRQPPSGGDAPGGEEIVSSLVFMTGRIEGAAQLALFRARDAAGSKILNWLRRDPERLETVRGVPTRDLAATLGRSDVKAMLAAKSVSEADLISGSRELILDALRVFGVDDEHVAAAIADTVQSHAARTLYEPKPQPLPANFAAYVEGLLRTSARSK